MLGQIFEFRIPNFRTSNCGSGHELLARLLPLQNPTSTVKVIAPIVEFVRSPKLEGNTERKAAIFVGGTCYGPKNCYDIPAKLVTCSEGPGYGPAFFPLDGSATVSTIYLVAGTDASF